MNQVTITQASIYSINGGTEIAYQIDYNEGTQVRAVESKGFIRTERKDSGRWVPQGKPYVVAHSKHRNAERIKATAIEMVCA